VFIPEIKVTFIEPKVLTEVRDMVISLSAFISVTSVSA
jgi:hypothetical protein